MARRAREWVSAGQHFGAELAAVFPVLNPPALCRKPFTWTYGWEGTDHGDQVAVPFGFDLKHPEAIVLVEESDPLDQPGEAFRQC